MHQRVLCNGQPGAQPGSCCGQVAALYKDHCRPCGVATSDRGLHFTKIIVGMLMPCGVTTVDRWLPHTKIIVGMLLPCGVTTVDK